jgi:hypothetical protein
MPKRKPIVEPSVDEQLAALDVLVRAALATQAYQYSRDARGLVRKELRERLRYLDAGRHRVGLVLLKLADFALHSDEGQLGDVWWSDQE